MATATMNGVASCLGQIGDTAGEIWHALNDNGPMSLAKLFERVGGNRDVVMQGVGWLAREGKQGPVIGFVTAVSDGVLCAYIPLLEVLPDWQSRGIGQELVRRMLASLSHLYMVDLCCDPELSPFYTRLGFHPAAGMLQRNYAVLDDLSTHG